ncbi:hypothetical protein Pelo_6938 [Pelomyxa schiedti]|nr:hypothetical protein Pelo_6938 [Pelomyxa schiedti]
MSTEKFPKVDKTACVGCGGCVSACPADLFELDTDGHATFKIAKKSECVHCEACVGACPVGAITTVLEKDL